MGILILLCGAILGICTMQLLFMIGVKKLESECVELQKKQQEILETLSTGIKNQFKELDKKNNPPAFVSDPFKGQKETYKTTKHIIVPKTPDEIRNENFEEIRKGAEYGYNN